MEIRIAVAQDIDAICSFGASHIPRHYEPLLGVDAAQQQVDDWWAVERIASSVEDGRIVVAAENGYVVGVCEWSLYEGTPVIWKLYVHPSHRGRGVGPRLISRMTEELPEGTDRIQVEHFARNRRAAAFYEREGFRELRTIEHPTNKALDVVWRELYLSEHVTGR